MAAAKTGLVHCERGEGVNVDDPSTWKTLFDPDVLRPRETIERNRYSRRAASGVIDNCMMCGMPIKDIGAKQAWLEHTISGKLIPIGAPVPMEGSGEFKGEKSQGCFRIGPECAKKPSLKPYIRRLG